MSNLQENEDCRYALYNVCGSFVLCIFWCPESTKTDNKELYLSSEDAFFSFIGVRKGLHRIDNIETFETIVADMKDLREKTLEEATKISQANARGKSCPISSMMSPLVRHAYL